MLREKNKTDEIDYKKLNYYRTTVPIYKTQNEIRTVLEKFNLQGTRFTEYKNVGIIEFILLKDNKELMFRFKYDLPEKDSLKLQVYKALFYYLKNRFLAVEFGITTVEKEFLQEIVVKLPNGTTTTVKELVGDKVLKLQYNDLKMLEEE
jgi:hypothetical protein